MKNENLLLYTMPLMCIILIFLNSCNKDDNDNKEGIPVLLTTAVTDITLTTAISGGNISFDGGAIIITRGVCWSTGLTPTISDNKTTDGTGVGNFISYISSLTPNTTFYVRAYATNINGTGYGNAISFTTSNSSVPVLSTTAVTGITLTTAISGGNINFDGGAIVTSRGVCWSTNQNPTVVDNKTTVEADVVNFIVNIDSLTPNTTYYARAYATNINGTGYGNAISFTTLNSIVPVLSTTAVTDVTLTTAKSGGSIIFDGGATITSHGVCWSTSQNPTVVDNKTTDGTDVVNFISNISSLAPSTTYYVRAYATNINGTGYGNAISFTTQSHPFTDSRDGIVYHSVTIGNQVWMAENLKYLPSVSGPAFLLVATSDYHVYGYNGTNIADAEATANYSTYGVLYNWPAAKDACPAGWHLPSDSEWTELTDYLGEPGDAGGKLKETNTTHWDSPNTGATNQVGFTALPGGRVHSNSSGGAFSDLGSHCYFWCSTTDDYYLWYAYCRHIGYNSSTVFGNTSIMSNSFSVRCVKD